MSKAAFDLERSIDGELRYTEQVLEPIGGVPHRRCCLWREGLEEDVSRCTVLSFELRFGQVAVAVEGYAGVQTRPEHRRKGYVSRLMNESLRQAAGRVDAAFLFGIEKLYGKFGFVTCLPSTHLEVAVRRTDRARIPNGAKLRPLVRDDLPAVVELYNRQHGLRPWTWRRDANSWDRLERADGWRPASEGVILELDGQFAGYMIQRGINYGDGAPAVRVQELAGTSGSACEALLAEAGRRCWQYRLASFRLYEPPDSLAGRVARRLGCDVVQSWKPDGGGMGVVLNRASLVERVAAELDRRLAAQNINGADQAVAWLAEGRICPDNDMLMRLLLGFWSWADAEAAGYRPPAQYEAVFRGWFCGGGTATLPMPFAHALDHY